ncbi:MAG: 16S rRNA (adenine(1518)-N(6)/adenine(1519)-N(6))-dimethyltransferase RsmA [Methylococcaceae bacterium]
MSHTPRKRFGQNFLQDHSIIHHIIASIGIIAKQHLVEIGPGQGALTEPLLKHDIQLDIVELDRDLVKLLEAKFEGNEKVTLHSADALRFDFSSLMTDDRKLRVIGNLPYNISTPLLFHLLENAACIEDMHFMLQKEVVDRLCAEPNSSHYGRLSIMMQYHCETELLLIVPPESFFPAPQVTSAVIRLIPHKTPPVQVNDIKLLNRVVTEAFCQRRKTLRNSLKKLIPEEIMLELGINPTLRAENISLAQFAQLSNYLSQN